MIFLLILLLILLLPIGLAWRRRTAADVCHPEESVQFVLIFNRRMKGQYR